MTTKTCAELQTQVENDVWTWYPPVLQLAMQVFALAPAFASLSGAGFVFPVTLSSGVPTLTPASAGAIGIVPATLRQFQWANSLWS